jgi:hypothetical protein
MTIRIELENDSDGHRWTVNSIPGSQKVRGSNPLGSTIFEIKSLLSMGSLAPPVALTSNLTAY